MSTEVKALRLAEEAGTVRAARSQWHREIHERMGIPADKATIHWDPNHPNERVFPLIDQKEARAILARAGEQPNRFAASIKAVVNR
jgi:hypothetical protein